MKRLTTLVLSIGLITSLYSDQVILDDLIVDGSACVGLDCVNGESFGFDTLRLKENNLRIKFIDTSSTASFPGNDWQITINDSSNGGANKFSIDDIDGGKTPFTIEASAPTHALYVDDSGKIGLGTNTPIVDLHIKSGNTPTLRLEQDGTSGFTPQTWDVAGNEANFFIRDASNGSTLPFRIFPGAPSNSFRIYPTYIDILNEVKMLSDLKVQGSIFTASDKNLKENFEDIDLKTILKKITILEISTWNFKDNNSSLRHIGPMAQDFYRIFKVGIDDKHIAPMDMASVALVGVQALEQKLKEKDNELQSLKAEMRQLQKLVKDFISNSTIK